ncbi:hypothetical protein BpHYR1_005885 [Brachionus plicatilis]|uniref:Uncharacterized protein n=1 Tax=Brachionus plicatilis TaxID=10195 RepID=A0A3M7PMX4_BRAPC|nr:hypothetical protein BpHYR1_005885 [Brachionus plicatilis]
MRLILVVLNMALKKVH